MAWDEGLEQDARNYAWELMHEHGCKGKHEPGLADGENLGSFPNGRTVEQVMTAYTEREYQWVVDRNNTMFPRAYHFTQVVWRPTKLIGCATARVYGCL